MHQIHHSYTLSTTIKQQVHQRCFDVRQFLSQITHFLAYFLQALILRYQAWQIWGMIMIFLYRYLYMHVLVILGSSLMIHHHRIIIYINHILIPKRKILWRSKMERKGRGRHTQSFTGLHPPLSQPLVHQSTENRSSTIK